MIMEQSGHLSADGVRSYERTTDLQRKAVSDVLTDVTTSQNNSTFDEVDKLMLSIPEPVLKTTEKKQVLFLLKTCKAVHLTSVFKSDLISLPVY